MAEILQVSGSLGKKESITMNEGAFNGIANTKQAIDIKDYLQRLLPSMNVTIDSKYDVATFGDDGTIGIDEDELRKQIQPIVDQANSELAKLMSETNTDAITFQNEMYRICQEGLEGEILKLSKNEHTLAQPKQQVASAETLTERGDNAIDSIGLSGNTREKIADTLRGARPAFNRSDAIEAALK